MGPLLYNSGITGDYYVWGKACLANDDWENIWINVGSLDWGRHGDNCWIAHDTSWITSVYGWMTAGYKTAVGICWIPASSSSLCNNFG